MMDLSSKRILVTGGGGFLGSHIVAHLRDAGCTQVFAPSRAEYDLIQPDAVERVFAKFQPEVVIHAAAAVGGIGANRKNPGYFFYANAIMGLQIIEAARRHAVERTVVIGTICSYPKITPVPFREEDLWNGYPDEVTGPYGIAKKAIMVQCQTYHEQYGLKSIFLMPVNLYGPGDHFDLEDSHVVPAIIRKCVEAKEAGSKEIVVWGDGTATREFLYVDDAAEGIVTALQHYDKPDPVNLGSGREVPIRELVTEIARVVDYKGSIRWDATKPNGQPRRCLDVSRAEQEFGFRAKTTLADGLGRTVNWYLSQRKSHSAKA